MKDSNTQYIVIGLIIIAGLLFLVSSSKKTQAPNTNTDQEQINEGDENDSDLLDEDEGEGVYETVKNPALGTENSKPSQTPPVPGKNETPKYALNTMGTKATKAQPVFEYLTLGTYFLPNIERKGIINCNPKKIGEEEIDRELADYDFENFELEKIVFKNNQAYIYVNAENIPEEVCAVVHQFTHPNTLFSGIQILVQ